MTNDLGVLGVEVFPSGSRVEVGATVVLLLRAGFWAPAPCRVVYVIEEANEVGFAYRTLPGHPERGEVAFTLMRADDELVTFVVRSLSRRVDPLARVGAPLARRAQTRVTRRYVDAIAEAAHADCTTLLERGRSVGRVFRECDLSSFQAAAVDAMPKGLSRGLVLR